MTAKERQDALLRQFVIADDAASGSFTAIRFQGGSVHLRHPGLAPRGVEQLRDGADGDIEALVLNGLLGLTARLEHGYSLVVTDATRAYVEALDAGDLSPVQAAEARAEKAEAALQESTRAQHDRETSIQDRRRRRADKVAWVPAAIVVVAVAVLILYLSQSGPLAALWGLLGAIGVAAGQLFKPVRSRIAGGLVRMLRFIHEQT